MSTEPTLFPIIQTVFSQGYVTANGKRVSKANLQADGGNAVIHIVTEVIPQITADQDIATVLASMERFSTLLSALTAADLASNFVGKGKVLKRFLKVSKILRQMAFNDKAAPSFVYFEIN